MNIVLATSRCQLRRCLHAPPQFEQRFDVVILLVAVERDEIRLRRRIEYRGDFDQPLQIGNDIAADLELEIAVAVGRHHLLQRFRQTVADLVRMTGNDIHQADSVASGDRFGGRQLRKKSRHVEARQTRADAPAANAGSMPTKLRCAAS